MKTEINDGVLRITLANPGAHQSFGINEARRLREAISNEDTNFIILTSADVPFCSGGNLQDYAKMTEKADGLSVNREITDILDVFFNLAVPKLAVVTGDCFGGGIELISCCQWIYSNPEAMFGLWQRRLGLSFGWGGYERLVKKINQGAVKSWVLDGETKTAQWCLKQGLLDRIISSHKIEDSAEQWLSQQSRLYKKSFKEIYENIDINASKTFESLWWSEYHKQQLLKYYK